MMTSCLCSVGGKTHDVSATVRILSPTSTVGTKTVQPYLLTPNSSRTVPPTQSKTPLSSTLTITPLDTIPVDARLDYLKNLVKSNGECNLPCILGFIPGQSTVIEMQEFLKKLGIVLGSYILEGRTVYEAYCYQFRFEICENIVIKERDHLIDYISLSGTRVYLDDEEKSRVAEFQQIWENYSPRNLLKLYGKPSRIKIKSSLFGMSPSYELWIFYDEKGFLVIYSGFAEEIGNNLHVCPVFTGGNEVRSINLVAHSTSGSEPIEKSVPYYDQFKDFLFPLEEISNLSIDNVYNLLLEDDIKTCFDFSKEWSK